eukprot:TRINITY_DN6188_c0_g2_i8.p1 TRINITY_DN6188_c0_g2~~TRINITY_DN6188_c0_g2_i8.p1  ORF type:complete len:129 (-),score=16.16 TRINITY_DN6188_c0_g2_i8:199-585(-)
MKSWMGHIRSSSRSPESLSGSLSALTVVHSPVVHLVHADNHLLDIKAEIQKSVLSGLSILGDTGLELPGWRGSHQNLAVSLGGSGDHVLDEVSVSWGIDDGEEVLLSLELPERDIDCDTTLSPRLELV